LRFIVADSLQLAGKIDEAIAQFEALEGTPLAASAKARLGMLRTTRQPAAAGPAGMPAYRPVPTADHERTVTPQVVRSQYVPPPAGIVAASPQPAQSQYISPSGSAVPVAPRPVPPATMPPKPPAAPETVVTASTRSAAAQKIVELNAAERYQEAGTAGLALLEREKVDEELQLIIANCLAWSGRLTEAITLYQGLTGGKLSHSANVGMGNAYRWRGRDDLATPLYRAVLAADPQNEAAKEGLTLAQRELRPRTMLTVGGLKDSSDEERRFATLNHRWRDRGSLNVYEIETSGTRDQMPGIEARQRDVTLRYHAQNLMLKPSFELSFANNRDQKVYGSLQLKFGERNNILQFGRVNWAKTAANPNALQANLSATHIGIQASQEFGAGTLTERLDYFDISDDNAISSGNIRFAFNARPLGSAVKPFVGIEFRDAKFNTSSYWSPDKGFGSFYGGLMAEWTSLDWSLYASAQAGVRLYGDAGTSWSLATGGKHWLSDDIGISVNLWSMASQRNNAAYRAQSVNVNLEKLW
jgi:tetratricopeptide (TPR) repeat protein